MEWTACRYITNSWGYGVILISRNCIRRLICLFSGRWENCPKFRQKFHGAIIRRLVITKRATYENWKIFFERGIIALHFGERYASLP